MTHERVGRDIEERTFAFGLRVLKVIRAMPSDVASVAVARQLVRSGTSIGANVHEAQGSSSRAEFVRRIVIARSEAMESRYWLRLVAGACMLPARRLDPLIAECDELVRILIAIVRSARRKDGQ